jgi:hypothetical protein
MPITPSLNRSALLILCISLISACALLTKPTPLTQLQLSLNAEQIRWPAALSLGSVQSRAVLKTDRVIVMRGALVMQHAGLRWTSAPEMLLAEQLSMLRMANTTSTSMNTEAEKKPARIDVWLSQFNVQVLPDGSSSATVAAAAQLNCGGASSTQQLALTRVAQALNTTDPQRIATSFNEAASAVVIQLLESADAQCRARPLR